MTIAEELVGEIIRFVCTHGEKTGEAIYSATIEQVRLGTRPSADGEAFEALMNRFAGRRLVVQEGKIVVHDLGRRGGKIEVEHPECGGKGCSDCWQGRLFYRCADPGEVDQ